MRDLRVCQTAESNKCECVCICRLHRAHLSRKYRLALSPQNKKQFELKVLAEKMFKGEFSIVVVHY